MEANRIFSAEQIVVLPEIPVILKQWTKEVIRSQTSDILQFSAEWFENQANASKVISEKERQQIKDLFNQYDVDQSGSIEVHEIEGFIRHDLGYDISDEDLALVVNILDASGSGYVTFDDILKWWSNRTN